MSSDPGSKSSEETAGVSTVGTRAAARFSGTEHLARLAEEVAQVPTQPGCYLWKDAAGTVIYVGKAKSLRARMRQYVTLSDERAKIPLMMQLVESFDYIVVDSEHEALVLERELIGQYRPYFNVDFKDDKSYPFIAITRSDRFPAIKYTREKHKSGTRYFGPYTDSRAARDVIDTIRKVIPICSATCAEWKRTRRLIAAHAGDEDILGLICAQKGRPCFDYHVGRGPGACVGAVTPEEYAGNVRRVERFLSGRRREVVDELKAEMAEAAADLDFERAARVKRRLEVIDGLDDRQQVVFPSRVDIDVVGFFREETIAGACVFAVRDGRMQRSCEFILDKGLDVGEEELVVGLHQALLRRDLGHPRRGGRGGGARGRRASGRVAHGEARPRVPPTPPAARREAPPARDLRAQRAPRPHALHDAHRLRGRPREPGAAGARERARPARAAAAHRVLRHLHHPRRLHGGLHGRVHERPGR